MRGLRWQDVDLDNFELSVRGQQDRSNSRTDTKKAHNSSRTILTKTVATRHVDQHQARARSNGKERLELESRQGSAALVVGVNAWQHGKVSHLPGEVADPHLVAKHGDQPRPELVICGRCIGRWRPKPEAQLVRKSSQSATVS